MTPRAAALFFMALLCCAAPAAAQPIGIGAKNFTEQEILAEIAAGLIERTTDLPVRRRLGLGGTDICHAALLAGEIDLYIEYTGTALVNVLRDRAGDTPAQTLLRVSTAYADRYNLEWLAPLGFNNTYALAVRADDAERLALRRISDLTPHAPALRAGFTAEFAERPDGLPGLSAAYGLSFGATRDLEPGLMYEALAAEQVDLICAFATDPRIEQYGLIILEDDRAFFPPYDAAPVARADLLDRHPELRRALALIAGAIDDADMRALNHAVDIEGRSPREVARRWLDQRLGTDDPAAPDSARAERPSLIALALERRAELLAKTLRHLFLTGAGVLIAIAIGVPLGVLTHRSAPCRGPVLAATEAVQTIPSLAMLAFLFALYGLLGTAPAVTALVLYALLPIVLNTFTGLNEVPARLIEAARGVGMTPWQRLRIVEIPLALPVMIAGIRAATVLTVGIATLSTYIGAGGLGDYIARGLARNDPRLTLLGALPAALMAVALSGAIRLVEKRLRRR